ncbi:MAG: envelope biogenesis factor ElyC [Coxiella sp. (in: Bacteria)]|nr:MAG: envelope biogenesis factor ElyC [Coxiella sp. (in: g-proteobacteria)]
MDALDTIASPRQICQHVPLAHITGNLMDFTLKKVIGSLLLPLPIALSLLVIGLLFFWFSRKKIVAGYFLSAGVLVLLVFSFGLIPTTLLNTLEDRYQPITTLPTNIHKIVVLGGGVRRNTNAPPNTQLSSASLSRLIEGVRLYRLYAEKHQAETLVLSGGRVFGRPAEAGIMQNIAVILGVKPTDIVLEAGSRDTAEEAKYLKQQLSTQPFLLVTSAYHMPRAIAIFKRLGLHPIAAPSQYITERGKRDFSYYVPNSKYLVMDDIAIHEYLGQLWAKLHSP